MHRQNDSCHLSGASGLLCDVGGGRLDTLTVGSAPASCFPFFSFSPSVAVNNAEIALAIKGSWRSSYFSSSRKKLSSFAIFACRFKGLEFNLRERKGLF